jgi:hypothetical protein
LSQLFLSILCEKNGFDFGVLRSSKGAQKTISAASVDRLLDLAHLGMTPTQKSASLRLSVRVPFNAVFPISTVHFLDSANLRRMLVPAVETCYFTLASLDEVH